MRPFVTLSKESEKYQRVSTVPKQIVLTKNTVIIRMNWSQMTATRDLEFIKLISLIQDNQNMGIVHFPKKPQELINQFQKTKSLQFWKIAKIMLSRMTKDGGKLTSSYEIQVHPTQCALKS